MKKLYKILVFLIMNLLIFIEIYFYGRNNNIEIHLNVKAYTRSWSPLAVPPPPSVSPDLGLEGTCSFVPYARYALVSLERLPFSQTFCLTFKEFSIFHQLKIVQTTKYYIIGKIHERKAVKISTVQINILFLKYKILNLQ